MDMTMLRHQALNLVTMRARAEATVTEIIADAEVVLAWLSADMPGAPKAAPPAAEAAPNTPEQHESAKANP